MTYKDTKTCSLRVIKSPRIGESVLLSPVSFEGQEETIRFRVIDVMHTVGPGYVKEIPVVLLDPIR